MAHAARTTEVDVFCASSAAVGMGRRHGGSGVGRERFALGRGSKK